MLELDVKTKNNLNTKFDLLGLILKEFRRQVLLE